MKDFNALSGPWTGMSIQDGLRITEAIYLSIREGTIAGHGTDSDGRFELVGRYDAATRSVFLTRRYTWTTEPSQAGAGIPYDYRGQWDGAIVSGRWSPKSNPWYGGPFEMWPNREEDRRELRIEFEELVNA